MREYIVALQSRAFCFPLYPVVDGCFSFAPALGADPVNSICAGSCYLHRVDAGIELTVPVVAQFRMKFRKHKKKPQKPILCGYTYLSYISYHIQFARMHKAKIWQIVAKLWHRQDAQGTFRHGVAKARKSTALPKYVISCIFLSFIANSCLLFGTGCAIIITEDDIIIQQMTHLKGVHHDFC